MWEEIARTVVYLMNRTATRTSKKTPYESWYGAAPDIFNVQIIGCAGWVHIPQQKRSKLDDRSHECWLVGYGDAKNHYRLWDPAGRKVVTARDVQIDESRLYKDREKPSNTPSSMP